MVSTKRQLLFWTYWLTFHPKLEFDFTCESKPFDFHNQCTRTLHANIDGHVIHVHPFGDEGGVAIGMPTFDCRNRKHDEVAPRCSCRVRSSQLRSDGTILAKAIAFKTTNQLRREST